MSYFFLSTGVAFAVVFALIIAHGGYQSRPPGPKVASSFVFYLLAFLAISSIFPQEETGMGLFVGPNIISLLFSIFACAPLYLSFLAYLFLVLFKRISSAFPSWRSSIYIIAGIAALTFVWTFAVTGTLKAV